MSINSLTSGANASSGIVSTLASNSKAISDTQIQLSTGKKILDPAQQGVVTRLASQVTSYSAAHNNITKAQNVLSVAATGLSTISNLLTQMQDLANKANDPTMADSDKDKLNATFQHLLTQVTTTANNSKVDGMGILADGLTGTLSIQTGLTASDSTDVTQLGSSAADLSIDSLDISSTGDAAAAITALQDALDTVSSNQSSVAADQAGLASVDNLNSSISANLQNTIDSIQKPDAAQLQMDLQNLNNQQSMNYYLINQMNQEAQGVLSIFR